MTWMQDRVAQAHSAFLATRGEKLAKHVTDIAAPDCTCAPNFLCCPSVTLSDTIKTPKNTADHVYIIFISHKDNIGHKGAA